jgi:hypothetical protein
VVQPLRHVRTLERLAVAAHKQACIALCPRRQDDVIDGRLVLPVAKAIAVRVDKELGKVEKLGDELSPAFLASVRTVSAHRRHYANAIPA